MQVTRSGTLAAGNPSVPGSQQAASQQAASQQAASLRYFHHDQLGSVAAVTDEAGSIVERMAYDPWGKRRGVDGAADGTDGLVGRTTDRGFTEHEHLDERDVSGVRCKWGHRCKWGQMNINSLLI
jgi:YD repeat-containing protein